MHEDKTLGDACGPGSPLQPQAASAAIPIAGLPPTNCWGYDKVKQTKEPVLWNAEAMRAQFEAGRLAGLEEAATECHRICLEQAEAEGDAYACAAAIGMAFGVAPQQEVK
jgi:hypothetical protein